MPVPLIVVGIAAAVAAAATAIGAAVAQGNLDKAKAIREQVVAQYGDDIIPDLDASIAEEVGPTAFEAIREDPATRESQASAMRRLSDLYESGGMSSQDEAALQIANQGAQQQAQSSYQAIQQQLAQRGQQNNPALMAALASKVGQTTAMASATNRYQAQADARNRAMQALGMSADIGGQLRDQDYSQAAALASATDRINQFNANQRTNANNEQNRRRMQHYGMRMDLANARANAYERLAGGEENQARATQSTAAGFANAASSAGAGIAGGMK